MAPRQSCSATNGLRARRTGCVARPRPQGVSAINRGGEWKRLIGAPTFLLVRMHFGPDFADGVDKTAASIRMALPARFEHMAQQKQAGELKTVEQVLIRPCVAAHVLTQKWRQPQQAVAPMLARGARDCPTRLR